MRERVQNHQQFMRNVVIIVPAAAVKQEARILTAVASRSAEIRPKLSSLARSAFTVMCLVSGA